MSEASSIVAAALAARTTDEAKTVQAMLAESVGSTNQRPVGDRYLNQDLWTLADEQAVSVERRAALEGIGSVAAKRVSAQGPFPDSLADAGAKRDRKPSVAAPGAWASA